jgi:hypothetical protein
MTDLARTERTLPIVAEHLQELLKTPLLALPPEVRPQALKVWAMNRHLYGLESPLSLAGSIAVWIDEHGLRSEDAVLILKRITHPLRMQEIKKTSDLMSKIAFEAAEAIRNRRLEAEAEERQRIASEPRSPMARSLVEALANHCGG